VAATRQRGPVRAGAMGDLEGMLKTLIHDYDYIHISVGVFGNLLFVIGSVLFFPSLHHFEDIGIWMFIFGSFMMFVGALGEALKKLWVDDNGGEAGTG
jgi:hypothetical protein